MSLLVALLVWPALWPPAAAFVAPCSSYVGRLLRSRVARSAAEEAAEVNADVNDEPRYAPADSFKSRSSFLTEYEQRFASGFEERRDALHSAMAAVGFDELEALLTDPSFRGSPALRSYNSFVFPKSEGALATCLQPHRARTIAESISFLVREQRAAAHEWLRNHDRCLAEATPCHPLYLVLDNVRSAANVGNIFRAAEAGRVAHLYTCGVTPRPPDKQLLKTAVGAAEHVRHTHAPSTALLLAELKEQVPGIEVWAVETAENSVSYHHAAATWPTPLALVFGNELIGVDTEVLDNCVDKIVDIPMHGTKNSLNVATCATVLIFETLRKWEEAATAP